MILTFLMFLVALCLSAVAAFYSIVGLTAIFSAAVTPIILMGSILEVAKLTVTVWLHEYWDRARWLMKVYLCSAVVVLMIITSMGIFGFLSKAHSDQSMVSGDVLAKIAIYDEKIKTERENIDANRKALKQMDEAVDQVMGRSSDEKGADKAVAIRRAQQKERARLLADIAEAQKKITVLNEDRAPIAAEVRKVEAEVGPIKYIAAFIYGDNPDANVLERAVRWVIIMLVIVFDPLAIMMLLSATESRKWIQELPKYKPDDGPLTDAQIEQIKETDKQPDEPTWMLRPDPSPPGWMYNTTTTTYPSTEEEVEELKNEFDRGRHAYLDKPFVHFENLKPMVHKAEDGYVNYPSSVETPPFEGIKNPDTGQWEQTGPLLAEKYSEWTDDDFEDLMEEDDFSDEEDVEKQAIRLWKIDNPKATIKEQRRLLNMGIVDSLPWTQYLDRVVGFGAAWPENPNKGQMHIRIDSTPTRLYKFNSDKWIEVDKSISDVYTYNQAYIDYLIDQISRGEYDLELLTNSEREQVEFKLKQELT